MKIALIVPSKINCGIADYSMDLRGAYKGEMDLIHDPLFKAAEYDILHVQFEAVLFRKNRTTLFPRLMQNNSEKVKIVTVHEVWDDNPYIEKRPVEGGLINFIRKIRYDFRHALEYREERLARLRYLSDAVIVHTRNAKQVLTKKGCDPEIIHVIPMPVFDRRPDPRSVPGLTVKKDKLVALMFGFITPATDYDTVLKAFTEVKNIYTLVIAGGTRRPEDVAFSSQLDHKIEELGLSAHVVKLGHVASKDLDALFTSANIFIHAPKIKTASSALANALGAGLPVIASEGNQVLEINAEHNCIRTFTPGDTDKIVLHMRELVDKDERVKARERIRFYAEEHTLDKFAESHLSLYRRLLEHRN
ncbi:MAG: glycosyltransferase [Fibrobacteres bacterium]|nr:glycosyltransferase [Fibrobacterota bacterium]